MKMIKTLGLTLAAATLMTFSAQAVPITGQIAFIGGVQLNTASAATATAVTNWTGPGPGPVVLLSTLNGPALPFGTATTFVKPWSFVSGPVANFWSVGGYSFDLTESHIFSQGGTPGVDGSVSVKGTGVLKLAGFDNTPGTWTFGVSDPGGVVVGQGLTFSFQAATGALPDGGSTLALLGVALIGLVGFARKSRNA